MADAPGPLDLFPPSERDLPALRELALALEHLGRARDLPERLDALEALVRWVAVVDASTPWPAGEADPGGGDAAYRRLGVLVAVLERHAASAAALLVALSEVVQACSGVGLYAEAGLARERGLFEEALERLQRRLLPLPRDTHELSRAVSRILHTSEHARWLERVPSPLLARLLRAARVERVDFTPQREALEGALCLLAARIEAIGLARPLRERRARAPVRETPWYRLPRATDRLLDVLARARSAEPGPELEPEDLPRALSAWREEVAGCRAGNAEVLEHLESTGVSAGLVFLIESSGRILTRMEHLLGVLLAPPGEARLVAGHKLLAELVRARHADGSLRQLVRDSTHLLSRKVVERTAETGEHYIAEGKREYAVLWVSALGGGAIAGLMAASKLALARFSLAPFVAGAASSANYVAGFVAMQFGHCTLATKQPSATAATLATILRHNQGPQRAARLTSYFARITHSQLAAAFGNILAVLVTGVLVAWLWRAAAGRPFVSPAEVDYVLASVHPWKSGTALYAAWTGVLLWLSSVAAGWFDNWFVYRRLPQAFADLRVVPWISRERQRKAVRWLAHQTGGLAGNVTLGVLLGMTPFVAQFLGLPLDVRHVTLTTGKIALCLSELGWAAWTDPRLPSVAGGVAVMFVLNLGVSFGLALWVAGRATGVAGRDARALFAAILRRIVRAPLEFLWPTRATRKE